MNNPENLSQRPNIFAPQKRDKTGEPRPEYIPIDGAILPNTGVTPDSLRANPRCADTLLLLLPPEFRDHPEDFFKQD